MDNKKIYRIIRHFKKSGRRKVIESNLTLDEAQRHCSRLDTHRAGVWFDGYEFMRGHYPKE